MQTVVGRAIAALALTMIIPAVTSIFVRNAGADELPLLQAGDKLKMTIYGKPEATGEFVVVEDGMVSLPLVGPVLAKGETTRRIEQTISQSLSEILHQPTFAGIELVERLPFYVLGSVNSPGSFPYKHPLSALQAVAVAGGLESLAKHEGAVIDAIREQGRVGVDTEALKHDLAARARLTADRDGQDAIAVPPELIRLAGRRAASDLVDAESKLLADETKKLKDQIAAFQKAEALGREELAAYQGQLDQLSHEEDVVKSELNGIAGLREQGLISRVRVFELEKDITTVRAEKLAVLALIARAKQNVASATQSMAETQLQHRLEVARRITELDQRIAQTESTMEGSSRIAQLVAPNVIQTGRARMHVEYEITRGDATLNATEKTLVLPGDTLRVLVHSEENSLE